MGNLDYKILGLEPDADLDAVRHKYDMLMKRSLRDESIDVGAVTKAYDSIMSEKTVDYFNPDEELLYKKGLNKKKVLNFIYQNKLRIGMITWIVLSLLLLLYILFFQPGNITMVPDQMPF
jgi:hypothetical protein